MHRVDRRARDVGGRAPERGGCGLQLAVQRGGVHHGRLRAVVALQVAGFLNEEQIVVAPKNDAFYAASTLCGPVQAKNRATYENAFSNNRSVPKN